MPSSPSWLVSLQRVREYRRDAALQLLAQQLQVAGKIRDAVAGVESNLVHVGQAQQQTGHAGRLDSERLRLIRQERDDMRSQLKELRGQQTSADASVREAQALAATKEAESEVLRRLQDRLDSAHRQAQRRREEQTPHEATVSLCNGGLSG